MDPITMAAIMAAVQGGLGLVQQGNAAIKRRQAQREFDQNKYQVPAGVKAMLSAIQNVASQTELPGADITRQRLASSTAQGVETAQRTAQSSSDVLGALHNLYRKQMDSQQDLAIAGAQNYQRNQLQYAQALGTLGQYQSQKWMYNTMYPYMQRMTEAGQIAQAGSANLGSAIQSGMNIAMADYQLNELNKMEAEFKARKGYGGNTPAMSNESWSNYSNNNPNLWESTKPVPYANIGAPQFSTTRRTNWWQATTPVYPTQYNNMEPIYDRYNESSPYR